MRPPGGLYDHSNCTVGLPNVFMSHLDTEISLDRPNFIFSIMATMRSTQSSDLILHGFGSFPGFSNCVKFLMLSLEKCFSTYMLIWWSDLLKINENTLFTNKNSWHCRSVVGDERVPLEPKKVAQSKSTSLRQRRWSFLIFVYTNIRLNSAKSHVYSSFWGFDLLVDTPPWGGGVPSGISGIKGKIAEISGIKDLSRNSRINDWGLQNQAF